ncbi:hypothetical protein Aperf_G00000032181 [Anoplocephala perfoliata]
MSTSLKPMGEEQPPSTLVATTSEAKPEVSASCCTLATETENESFSVNSIPFELLECTKLNLQFEVSNLEYEFRQLKEALYEARIAQVDCKLDQLRRAEASELRTVNEMVDGLYDERKQVAKHRRDFELASANNEYDNAIQTANNDAEENIRNTYERLHERIQESICTLQVEHAMAKRSRRSFANASNASRDEPLRQQNAGLGHPHHHRSIAQPSSSTSSSATLRISPEVAALLVPGLEDDSRDFKEGGNRSDVSKRTRLIEREDGEEVEEGGMWSESPEYLPGPDLEPRRKPVSLLASTPCFIYNLDPEDIEEDLQQINNALKEQKLNMAMNYLKSRQRES